MELIAAQGKETGIRFPGIMKNASAWQFRRFISFVPDVIRYCVRSGLRFVFSARQERKLHMYRSVQELFEEHSITLAGLPILAAPLQELSELIGQIIIRVRACTGVRKNAKELMAETAESVYDLLIPICFALFFHARKTCNPVLMEKTLFRERNLRNLSIEELVVKAESMANEGMVHEEDLKPYGISAGMVADMLFHLRMYREMQRPRKSRFAEQTEARGAVSACCIRADELLREDLDRLIELFRCTHPRLYNDYFFIRDEEGSITMDEG